MTDTALPCVLLAIEQSIPDYHYSSKHESRAYQSFSEAGFLKEKMTVDHTDQET